MSAPRTALGDREVLELLAGRPDLLAIADAVAATQPRPAARRLARRTVRLAAVAAVLGLATLVALVSPWSDRAGFVDRALAAIGSRDVVHVVESADVPGRSVVDLRSGAEAPVVRTTEIWFDDERGLLRSVQRVAGTVTSEVLETPEGSWTEAGQVYTCAWIAAHPVEATRLRVSCNPSGDNGTVPRRIPEPRPALPPSLAGFVTGYRDALERGEATRDGSGVVAGQQVEWLRFAVPHPESGPAIGGERVERVAVDAVTLEPVRVETLVDGTLVDAATISVAETLDRAAVAFERPKLEPWTDPISSRNMDDGPVTVAAANEALQGRLVDAGEVLAGLARRSVSLETIVSSYDRRSSREPTSAAGVNVLYGGPIDPAFRNDYVLVKEAIEPLLPYRFPLVQELPPEGSLSVTSSTVHDARQQGQPARLVGTRWTGHLRVRGVYVTIEATSKPLLLEAAHTLASVPKP